MGEANGNKLTLLWCQEKTKTGGRVGILTYMLSSFHCDYILKGIHFLSETDIKFAQINVNFTSLEDWIFPKPFKHEGMDVIRYINPPRHDIYIDRINSTISIVSDRCESNDFKTICMSFRSFFIIRPLEVLKDLRWYEEVIFCLGNFLTLTIGKPTYSKTITAYLSNDDNIEILFILSDISSIEGIHFSQMMISYKNLANYLEEFLNNWFNYSDTLKPVYELFFGTYYNTQLYPIFYFLSMIQAIEAFHRRIYTDRGNYLSDIDYEPIRNDLTNAIITRLSDGSVYPTGFKDALKSKVKYGNEISLRTRLKQLYNDKWESFDLKIDANRTKFINDIVCTRNYLTHYERDSSSSCRVFEGTDLNNVNMILKSLFIIVLLTHMGIPKPDAFKIVREKSLTNAINEIFKDEMV